MKANKPNAVGEVLFSRREFLYLSAATGCAVVAGCATNPVTGERQFMLVSEQEEVGMDRDASPHQFSADYGAVQDDKLNSYIATVCSGLAANSHRPNMPYTFRGVNAAYVNAYAFPGGSIAITRGLLLSMQNEAELAAVMGHEIGHVCARHTAHSMSKGMLINLGVALAAAAVEYKTENEGYAALTAGLGSVATGALLARYSRANEHQADELAMEYMVRAGYTPEGCRGLMDVLRGLSKHKPNVIELMFATHPMSEDRYRIAVDRIQTKYQSALSLPDYRDRYMDHTARLRAAKDAILKIQDAENALAANKLPDAVGSLKEALQKTPNDYTALLLMAKCRLAEKKYRDAAAFARQARDVYPQEAQAMNVLGLAELGQGNYDRALEQMEACDKALPGNPTVVYFQGYALEQMNRRQQAAEKYGAFLRRVTEGEYARHAYARLVAWGYIKPPPKAPSAGTK